MYTAVKAIRVVKNESIEQEMVFGTGRLTNDPPAIKPVGSNGARVMQGGREHKFSIAFPDVSLGKDGQGRTKSRFYNIVLWDKNADNMAAIGFKGQWVEVAGRIEKQGENGQYEVLVIEKFEAKEYKERSATTGSSSSTPKTAKTDPAAEKNMSENSTPAVEIGDDDIPF